MEAAYPIHPEVFERLYNDWGECQVGLEGYEMVAESDAQSISPGSEVLARLFKKYSPCLILIDEWVAYFRGIYSVTDTAAGSFETNLTFAQALTVSVLDDLDQGLHVPVETLGEQTGHGIALADQAARCRGVDGPHQATIQGPGGKALEIAALAPRDIDHLNELARAKEKASCRPQVS